jgi:hypothetical protein
MGNTKDAGAAPDERATHIHSGVPVRCGNSRVVLCQPTH